MTSFDGARIMDRLDMPSRIEINTERTGVAVFAPVPIGPDIVLGRARDDRAGGKGRSIDQVLRGDSEPIHYLVCASKLDRPWPGTDRTVTFAVHRLKRNAAGRYEPVESWGFFEEEDCYRFLTTDKIVAHTVWDLLGVESVDKRRGLGLPDSAVERFDGDALAVTGDE